jgi:hypothetical protein
MPEIAILIVFGGNPGNCGAVCLRDQMSVCVAFVINR